MADDPYRVLGVDRDAELATIRRAYLAALRANHPDLRPGDDAAEERTRQLNRAWEQIRRRATSDDRPRHTSDAPRTRPARTAYSNRQRDYRTAFTAATVRVAMAVVALGLILLVVGR